MYDGQKTIDTPSPLPHVIYQSSRDVTFINTAKIEFLKLRKAWNAS